MYVISKLVSALMMQSEAYSFVSLWALNAHRASLLRYRLWWLPKHVSARRRVRNPERKFFGGLASCIRNPGIRPPLAACPSIVMFSDP